MSEEHRAASRALWEGAAENWVSEAERREAGAVGRVADRMLEAVALRPGEHVIELACGAGDVGLRAAEAVGVDGRVLCTDFAEPMVARVRQRAEALSQVEARVLDAENPGLDERFDVALCRLGYMLMPDPARALRATHDLLVPGGRLALAVWAPGERNPWLSLLFDAVMGVLGAPPPAPGTPGPFALGDPDRLSALVEGAGFEDLRLGEVTEAREYASPAEWWERMQEGSTAPVATMLTQLPAEQAAAIRDRAVASAEAHREGDVVRFPAALLVASARRAA